MRLVLPALALLSWSAFAADLVSDLDVARSALRDGLWDVARRHAAKVSGDESRLIILESYAGEQKWDDVRRFLLGWEDARGDAFDYYRAILKGDHAKAMEILKRGGSESGLVEARLYEANELAKTGDAKSAAVIWGDIASRTNAGERVLAVASMNLGEAGPLRRAYSVLTSMALKRAVGLRLGRALLKDAATAEEGVRLVRSIVNDSPDADGASDAMLAVLDWTMNAERWAQAEQLTREIAETWPVAAKRSSLQENRGWVLHSLGRHEDAADAFLQAELLATSDEDRARAMLKQGDELFELRRKDEAMKKYRQVLETFPKLPLARRAADVIRIRELETKGREHYKAYRFDAAMDVFQDVATADPARRPMMDYFRVLCLYGQGRDAEAGDLATKLAAEASTAVVRANATLWLAKFKYNRKEWKESRRLFTEYAAMAVDDRSTAEAMLWAARAAFAENDFPAAVQLSTRLLMRYPEAESKASVILLQGEALMELARFDEAILVLERVPTSDAVSEDERRRAQMLKADALYAMGADNPRRYDAALESYSAITFAGPNEGGGQIVVSFKIARTLEKLKRIDEARDQYYSKVVIPFVAAAERGARFTDNVRSAFSRAAFWLADDFESNGHDSQAIRILRLVVASSVPAAEEAAHRIERLSAKGMFL